MRRMCLRDRMPVWRFASLGLVFGSMVLPAQAQAQTADIELVVLTAPSAGDTSFTLPTSEGFILNDAGFIVEVWSQTTHSAGLSSVSTDISFEASLVSLDGATVQIKKTHRESGLR